MSNYSQTTSQNRRQLMTAQADTPVKPRTGRIIKVMQSDFAAAKERNEADYTDSAIWARHRERAGELQAVPEKRNIFKMPVMTTFDAIQERHEKTKQFISSLPDIQDEFETLEKKSRLEKVTSEQVMYILAHYIANDKTVRTIANDLGMSRMTVYEILKRDCEGYELIRAERQAQGGKYVRKKGGEK